MVKKIKSSKSSKVSEFVLPKSIGELSGSIYNMLDELKSVETDLKDAYNMLPKSKQTGDGKRSFENMSKLLDSTIINLEELEGYADEIADEN